ncbi:hypothetical protein EVAR_95366_1 [Eumeta japonica]|uniref:Uncharacterized protein n=1 Tax=Eumeta variegata TaxID=151549 RepID=A0A4C1U991_EUMVA|nr:hypothetical protein EVAR_95366_1 [Eumeta japonica]
MDTGTGRRFESSDNDGKIGERRREFIVVFGDITYAVGTVRKKKNGKLNYNRPCAVVGHFIRLRDNKGGIMLFTRKRVSGLPRTPETPQRPDGF